MGVLICLAGEAWRGMMRGKHWAEASPALSVPIIPQCNSMDISLLTTGDGHFPMKINMLYFPHTLENTHTHKLTRTGVCLSELGCQQTRLQTPPTTCRHLRGVLSKCSINAQHGVCVLYCRIIWHAIKTDFNALQPKQPSHSFRPSPSHLYVRACVYCSNRLYYSANQCAALSLVDLHFN